MWGPLQFKPPTDHPVSKVRTHEPIQRLSCGMGWGSILLKPPCFSSQPPFVYPETSRTSQGPLCTAVCLPRGRFLSHPQTGKVDDDMSARCYPRCASHRVEKPLQDHVGRLASPPDIVLPADIPREVEIIICFIRKPNASQKVRRIFSHVGDPFRYFHSLLHYELLSAFV